MTDSRWPENLEDYEAVDRLQALLIAGCEGNRDLGSDRSYKLLRKALIRRSDLADVVPSFVRSHRDLTSFWAYIRNVSKQYAPRREHVWNGFRPLFDRVEGRTHAQKAQNVTGKRTAAQQAQVVLNLAPDALCGVETLLEEFERPLHNGGPVDPQREDAIARLRELHEAIGELIRLAGEGKPLARQMTLVQKAKASAFQWSLDSYRLGVAGIPLLTSSAVVAGGVMFFVNVLTKGAVDAETIGMAAAGVHATGALAKASNSTSP